MTPKKSNATPEQVIVGYMESIRREYTYFLRDFKAPDTLEEYYTILDNIMGDIQMDPRNEPYYLKRCLMVTLAMCEAAGVLK